MTIDVFSRVLHNLIHGLTQKKINKFKKYITGTETKVVRERSLTGIYVISKLIQINRQKGSLQKDKLTH